MVALLCSCNNMAATSPAVETIFELELTENYDNDDPFVNAKLFSVTEHVDTLELQISFQMEGESGLVEIADNDTKEVLWSDTWHGDTEATTFTVTLGSIDQAKDYAVQFTGTNIKYAKVAVASANDSVIELERPRN